ncbi:hypothetical protein A3K73_04665 [Candidatus Pacearchaeota archaeon RBG_13_36_9]|nr:MAG: hypothetical protein A3K73_04665 [Candidatus Pacearchaeota archaeon RBG_13_36_9]
MKLEKIIKQIKTKGNAFCNGLGDILTLEMNSFRRYGAFFGSIAPPIIFGYLAASGSGILSPEIEEYIKNDFGRQYVAGMLVALTSAPGLTAWCGIPMGIVGYTIGKEMDNMLNRFHRGNT